MGVVVQLVDERGNVLAGASDPHDLVDRVVGRGNEELRVLRWVDPYGDTVFNQLQIPALLEDWMHVRGSVTGDRDEETWQRVRELAEQCARETHVYLRFTGD
jgi:hypothetical protein